MNAGDINWTLTCTPLLRPRIFVLVRMRRTKMRIFILTFASVTSCGSSVRTSSPKLVPHRAYAPIFCMTVAFRRKST